MKSLLLLLIFTLSIRYGIEAKNKFENVMVEITIVLMIFDDLSKEKKICTQLRLSWLNWGFKASAHHVYYYFFLYK